MHRGITQELGERPAGLDQAIGELEELRHGEARTQDVGFEFALHVPLQGDPAIEQLLIDPASEDELDEGIRQTNASAITRGSCSSSASCSAA